jgi:ligand-binding sensor domain-containing protein
VEALALAADGLLLVGIGQSGVGMGIQTITGGEWKPFTMPGENSSILRVAAILDDRDGGVWISTQDAGIYHVHAGRTDRFLQIDGLSSDTGTGLFEDREGNIWAVTPRGIDHFRDIAVGTVSRREGLVADSVASVLSERSGELRVANGNDLVSLLAGRLSFTDRESGLPGNSVTSQLEGHAGRLWLGIDTAMEVLQNGHFRSVRRADGGATGMVTGLAEDTEQNIWALVIQRRQQLLRIRDFQIVQSIPLPDPAQGGALTADRDKGVWLRHVSGSFTRYRGGDVKTWQAPAGSGTLRNLITGVDGSVWAAATKGLIRLKDGKSAKLDHRNGLPCDGIFALIFDVSGSLWLYAECGLVEISSTELERWWAHPEATLAVRTLDILDGAQPGATPFAPAATRSPDGRLWFTNDNVLQFVDPQKMRLNSIPPPIRIEQIVADGARYCRGRRCTCRR